MENQLILLYIRDAIPTKLLKHDFGTNIENLSVEINLRKRKCFFNDFYNPHKNKISNHLNYLILVCSKYSKIHDNFIFMGGFNVEINDTVMNFFALNNLENLIKKPTCNKNHENPTNGINLILTNRPSYF